MQHPSSSAAKRLRHQATAASHGQTTPSSANHQHQAKLHHLPGGNQNQLQAPNNNNTYTTAPINQQSSGNQQIVANSTPAIAALLNQANQFATANHPAPNRRGFNNQNLNFPTTPLNHSASNNVQFNQTHHQQTAPIHQTAPPSYQAAPSLQTPPAPTYQPQINHHYPPPYQAAAGTPYQSANQTQTFPINQQIKHKHFHFNRRRLSNLHRRHLCNQHQRR